MATTSLLQLFLKKLKEFGCEDDLAASVIPLIARADLVDLAG